MTTESMKNKAVRFFELTDTGGFPPPRPNAPQKMQEMRQTLSDEYRNLRIKLFAECYSEEQLHALLEFYESDLGRSILKTQIEIEQRFKKEMSKFMNSLDSGNDGDLGVIVEKKK